MAQKVKLAKGKEFTFKVASSGGGGETKYPWDEWFNGDLLLIARSEGTEDDKGTITTISEKRDYEVRTDAMPAKLKTAARRRYKVVQISRLDEHGNKLQDALIIRARDMNAEERTAEDMLRAEEKEAREAKKAAENTASNGQAEAPATSALQA